MRYSIYLVLFIMVCSTSLLSVTLIRIYYHKSINTSTLIMDVRQLMNCPHRPNITQRELYRVILRSCCNATGEMILTNQNTKSGQKIHYETNQKLFKTVDKKLHSMLPKDLPWSNGLLGHCAVVGSGGILQNNSCGAEIDRADYIIRFNLGPVTNSKDVGNKTHLMTINPSQIRSYRNLTKAPLPLVNRVAAYGNASLLLPAFSYTICTKPSLDVYHALRPLRPNQVVFFNPNFMLNLGRKWKGQGLKERRLSTGLMLASVAMELCKEVHIYGFWPFSLDLNHNPLPHHYYDNVGPNKGVHSMPEEFLLLLKLHTQGVLQLHLGRC
ncbi:alpha-2,8-sialyltransferase 8F isoform X2 [Oncorhynchus tshawytscha]|uniref:alpha-2,8-sialyltransferase 8F isoform X2 n=1 Tax=Oncorhynchus tshawytscha TaxID=74940 RepID=UPI000D0A4D06|nr:alpha-2,8-sialyltransferase 8F isoform X2 [Oncorhynchus tshawytscha]